MDGDAWVSGEVYRLRQPVEMLRVLDEYEGDGYRRVLRVGVLASGERVRCWVYCYLNALPEHRRIISGDWRGSVTAPSRYRPMLA